MRRDDPFETWDIDPVIKRAVSPQKRAELDVEAREALDQLRKFLDHPPPGRSFWDARIDVLPRSCGLPLDQMARAQDLYRRVMATGGAGSTYVQEYLLDLIAATEDPASISFWLDIVTLVRPRDSFSTQRRIYAVAALARLAICGNLPETYAALRQLARHERADVRALALYYLGRAFLGAERPVPVEVLAEVGEIAARDAAFEPRFQARSLLRATENPVPLDNPEGVYTFKVNYKWDKDITHTIELKSEQTLEDLHHAIQRALKWDSDHLYSFYMNGEKYDWRCAFACPYQEVDPPWTDEAVIGELGLMPKHRFLYYFDYGDSHEFEIQVVGILRASQVEPGGYPRVVASQGVIRQYPAWGESEEDTDD